MTRATQPDYGRAVLVPVFVGLIVLNVAALLGREEHKVLEVLGTLTGLTFYGILVVLYLRRGSASRTDRRPAIWLAAGAATFSPFLIPVVRPGGASTTEAAAGSLLVVLGIGLSVWALLSLNTNISVVPQARKLATTGPYRYFRHPLYVFEYVAALGLALLSGGGWAWVVVATLGVLQVLRARWEEQLLHEQIPEYAEYRASTPGFGRG